MKLLLDMNLSPKIAGFLVNEEVQAIHWITVGAPDASDTEIMMYAKDNNCVVVTHDLDFSVILSITHGLLPSIIQIRNQNLDNEQISQMVAIAVKQNAAEIDQGAILSIDLNHSRLRLLPL